MHPVPRYALGLWGLLGDAYGARPDSKAGFSRAAKRFSLFDSAPYWGIDRSVEKLLGDAFRDSPEKPNIISRLDIPAIKALHGNSDAAGKLVRESLQRSAANMGKDKIEFAVVPMAQNGECDASLRRILNATKSEGLLESWGISAPMVDEARILDLSPDFFLTAVHLFHVAPLEAWNENEELQRIELWGHSPLLHGLLANDWPEDQVFAEEDHRSRRWTRTSLKLRVRQANRLRSLLDEETQTPTELAYAFLRAQPHLKTIIGGPQSEVQIDAFIRGMHTAQTISQSKLDAIERICVAARTEQ